MELEVEMDKLINIYKKNKEVINYLIFGVLTTIISLIVYYFLTFSLLDSSNEIELQIANLISWIISVIFAYITNRKYVFSSKNDNIIKDKYLYNRCHLIGWQLAGENANKKNLITGTRYFNVDGMLPFENMVADYVTETGNHVIYEVTPVFSGENLVAEGVHMQAYSVEDNGDGICFNVFVYNVQPNVEINYEDGSNHLK